MWSRLKGWDVAMLLAGDVGGIKTALVRRFLDLPIDRACFAVAEPVFDGRTKITNLTWVLDERDLAEEPGLASEHLINDLEAIAPAVFYGIGSTIPGPPALVAI